MARKRRHRDRRYVTETAWRHDGLPTMQRLLDEADAQKRPADKAEILNDLAATALAWRDDLSGGYY